MAGAPMTGSRRQALRTTVLLTLAANVAADCSCIHQGAQIPASIYNNFPTENPGKYQNYSSVSYYGTMCATWDRVPGTPWFDSCNNSVDLSHRNNSWCNVPWCYVAASCSTKAASSVFNGSTSSYFSYFACGQAPDCYSNPNAAGCPYNPHGGTTYTVFKDGNNGLSTTTYGSCACKFAGSTISQSIIDNYPVQLPGKYNNTATYPGVPLYGSTCAAWDQAPGTPWYSYCPSGADWCDQSKNWCQIPWCYVDSSCSTGVASSVFNGSSVASYSYDTCLSAPDCYTNSGNENMWSYLPATCPFDDSDIMWESSASCPGGWSRHINYTSLGSNTACRNASGTCSGQLCPNYDIATSVSTSAMCQMLCDSRMGCTGIEYSGGRCELWKVIITQTASASGFECMNYTGASKTADVPIAVKFKLSITNLNLTAASMMSQAALAGIIQNVRMAVQTKSVQMGGPDLATLAMSDVVAVLENGMVQLTISPSNTVNPIMAYEIMRGAGNGVPAVGAAIRTHIADYVNNATISALLVPFTVTPGTAYTVGISDHQFVINPSGVTQPTPAPSPGSPTPAPNVQTASSAYRGGLAFATVFAAFMLARHG
eukprot:CAMPEP_0168441016 /NCGR_PEP_ID=MMETSP0228-20121227/43270_1 /TAXON_ID=133427 /ORGANISM="Protoceratium reticulatum, Strain CCCM 535 (=CCMP 1889)" /LENGTH=597 /DNA_ID=CAMNT_0008455323 /DNA_START=67 /DNA_END=1860 /DNA_ORIENTATION=+